MIFKLILLEIVNISFGKVRKSRERERDGLSKIDDKIKLGSTITFQCIIF